MKDLPHLLSIERIWDDAPHNAMTDLISYNGFLWSVFREGEEHVGVLPGKIRLIRSKPEAPAEADKLRLVYDLEPLPNEVDPSQGVKAPRERKIDGSKDCNNLSATTAVFRSNGNWESIALFEEEGVDLRDPKLSISPNGNLMLLMGGTVYDNESYVTRQPRVSFSKDGLNWSPLHKILSPHEWLWRITWHKGVAYGASYRYSNPKKPKEEWELTLFKSEDGLHFQVIKEWEIHGYPNETTLRFLDDTMIALVRREDPEQGVAWLGMSDPPYTKWKWTPLNIPFEGPNFLITPSGDMWAAGRHYLNEKEVTVLGTLTENNLTPLLILPSDGDNSYPGLVLDGNTLWMSYYSSHEEKTAIYLAHIQLP